MLTEGARELFGLPQSGLVASCGLRTLSRRFDNLVGGEQAGFSMYTRPSEDPDDQRIFYHTVIDDAFGGRGLAGILTRTALLTSVAEGHRIVAVCPYVAHWLRSHDDVEGSVDTVRPVHREAVRLASAEADAAGS